MLRPRQPGEARRRALVTGTSSGIGAAIARRLLDGGWEVVGLDRAAADLVGPGFTGFEIDLLDTSGLSAIVDGLHSIQAVVHAAGFMRVAPIGALDADAGRDMWRLHVEVAEFLANALAPRMAEGGRIVLIGSRTSNGAAGRSQYAATKAALVGMARSWAIELAPRGITVNVVAPAATQTPMLRDRARGAVEPKVPPIGRFVRPEEVAALTSFLLSVDAAAITGQQLVICGGSSL
ncbi:MAG: SDR family NAD(P)-dependent oxidoreductase [Betaproteobacteria bacterium]